MLRVEVSFWIERRMGRRSLSRAVMLVKEERNGCVRVGDEGRISVAKRGAERVPMQPARSALEKC